MDLAEAQAAIRARLDADEQWAIAASAPYRHTDEPTPVPDGVRWQWVAGDQWEPVTVDPVTQEYVADGREPVWLASVETWPSRGGGRWQMPATASGGIEEMRSTHAGHIVRHDPRRVLTDVRNMRAVLEYCDAQIRNPAAQRPESRSASAARETAEQILRLLAGQTEGW